MGKQYRGSDWKMREPVEHVRYLLECAGYWKYWFPGNNDAQAEQVRQQALATATLHDIDIFKIPLHRREHYLYLDYHGFKG